MWSQPRLSAMVHVLVATGLLAAFVVMWAMKQRHPEWHHAALFGLLPAKMLNYTAAGVHIVRLLWLR